MRYASTRVSWALFALAVLLLISLGIAADRTTTSFAESTSWVSHTREVETSLEKIRADLFAAESGRQGYILSGIPTHQQRYQEMQRDVPRQIASLRILTKDNAMQQKRIERLASLVDSRFALLDESFALRATGKPDRARQDEITAIGVQVSSELVQLLDDMKEEEGNLLRVRTRISQETYIKTRAILAIAFFAVVVLFFANFWQLLQELRDRKRAEDSVRRLSGRILQLQDTERRKVARELHDSIGQYFAGLKMNLEMLAQGNLNSAQAAKTLSQSLQLLEQGLAETRTLSHLLHPPLLDEVGFASAASWFVDGFSQRSKIQVTLDLPEQMQRMPRDIELALFRVLQEGLTNIHRHSGSASATVRMESHRAGVKLVIQDFGKGIPEPLLQEFRRTSTGTGVGLAGMRERVVELGGRLEVECKGRGTCLQVDVPLPTQEQSTASSSGPNVGRNPGAEARRAGADAKTSGLMFAQA